MTTTSPWQGAEQIDIQVGALIIRERLLLPTGFEIPADTYSEGWKTLNTWDERALDRNLRLAGWNFFCVAGMLEASAIGSTNRRSTATRRRVHKTVNRILRTARARSFNCVEITNILGRHFLGIPYITVIAQSRHIQESRLLQNTLERTEAQHKADILGHAKKSPVRQPGVSLTPALLDATNSLCKEKS